MDAVRPIGIDTLSSWKSDVALTYYLTIDGLNGGSKAAGHVGAFAIADDFAFDVSALVAPADQARNTGPADFEPLTVDLLLTSGLTGLLGKITAGKEIPSIRIEGVIESGSANETLVYDLLLNGVALTAIHGSNGADDLDRLVFDYKSLSLTTTALNPNTGQPTTPVTFAWDALEHSPPSTPLAEPNAAVGIGTGGDASSYFLTIAGVNGGSLNEDHVGAFEIQNFDFDVSKIGKVEFSPLAVDLILESGLTGLIDQMAHGEPFSSIRIQGVNAAGQAVYDLRLGDVALISLHDSSDQGKLDRLTFDYGQVTLTTTPLTATGALGNPTTFGWNLETNTTFAGSLPDPVAGKLASGGGVADEFYLTIDGLGGDSTDKDHQGAFTLHGFDLDVSALVARIGGTIDIGRAQFDPLTVDLQLNAGLTRLLDQMAEGKHIPTISIEGAILGGTTSQTVYDLTLGDVVVTRIHDRHGEETVDSLTLQYSRFSLTTTPPEPQYGSARGPRHVRLGSQDSKGTSSPAARSRRGIRRFQRRRRCRLLHDHRRVDGRFEECGSRRRLRERRLRLRRQCAARRGSGGRRSRLLAPDGRSVPRYGAGHRASTHHRQQAYPLAPDRGRHPGHQGQKPRHIRSQARRRPADQYPRCQKRHRPRPPDLRL